MPSPGRPPRRTGAHCIADRLAIYEILSFFLLQYEPGSGHVITGMAPVAHGVQVAEIETVLEPQLDAGERAGDLAGHESLPAGRGFVIEQERLLHAYIP